MNTRKLLSVAAGILLIPGAWTLRAGDPELRITPPGGTVECMTMGEWTAKWWQWYAAIPAPVHPTKGGRCDVNQGGPVYFLAGSSGGTGFRDCIIPAGKSILLSALNVLTWAPGDCDPLDMDMCKRIAEGFLAPPILLEATINGITIDIEAHREKSPVFDFTVPEDNVFALPPPLIRKGVSDGFWLMLEDVAEGEYEIHLIGVVGDGQFVSDVLYKLHIVAAKPPPTLSSPGAIVHGKSIGDWTVEWWRWFMKMPVGPGDPVHPAADTTGQRCGADQAGPVFFLAGTQGGSVCRNECVIPCNKSIFFPILNGACSPEPDEDIEDCRRLGAAFMESAFLLEGRIDGVPIMNIEDQRADSPEFVVELPASNVLGITPPLLRTFVSDGYWIMIEFLAPGEHSIHFKALVGTPDDVSFSTEVAYHFVVQSCPFRRGDSNDDGKVDLSDSVFSLDHLFRGGSAPACMDAADSNDDGKIDLSDPVFSLNHLFLSGAPIPFPGLDGCGPDPTLDDYVDCSTSCTA